MKSRHVSTPKNSEQPAEAPGFERYSEDSGADRRQRAPLQKMSDPCRLTGFS